MRKEDYNLIASPVEVPSWWQSRYEQIVNVIENGVKKGEVKLISTSPGGRKVYSVSYGEKEPELKGTANFNSAIGGRSLESFYNRDVNIRKRPVIVVQAGMHGQEMEGMVALTSLIKILETGKDIMGREQAELAEKLSKVRIIIIPIANPDGRVRVPYDGWVGLPINEMTKWGQGTMKSGELYGWPKCKRIHPMKGDVGILGAYFDDNGVNMAHDEWTLPMSNTTKAIFDMVRDEAPNMFIDFHSCGSGPVFMPTTYIPMTTKKRLEEFKNTYKEKLEKQNYHFKNSNLMSIDGEEGRREPAFNFVSMLYHTGADLPFVFENPHGCIEYNPYGYEDILNIDQILVGTAIDYICKKDNS